MTSESAGWNHAYNGSVHKFAQHAFLGAGLLPLVDQLVKPDHKINLGGGGVRGYGVGGYGGGGGVRGYGVGGYGGGGVGVGGVGGGGALSLVGFAQQPPLGGLDRI
jgi:hypothetical protein